MLSEISQEVFSKDLRICLPVRETQVRSLGREDPLVEGMATHSSILAWEIPWTEEPEGLQTMGLQRVRHNWATKQHNKRSAWCPGASVRV